MQQQLLSPLPQHASLTSASKQPAAVPGIQCCHRRPARPAPAPVDVGKQHQSWVAYARRRSAAPAPPLPPEQPQQGDNSAAVQLAAIKAATDLPALWGSVQSGEIHLERQQVVAISVRVVRLLHALSRQQGALFREDLVYPHRRAIATKRLQAQGLLSVQQTQPAEDYDDNDSSSEQHLPDSEESNRNGMATGRRRRVVPAPTAGAVQPGASSTSSRRTPATSTADLALALQSARELLAAAVAAWQPWAADSAPAEAAHIVLAAGLTHPLCSEPQGLPGFWGPQQQQQLDPGDSSSSGSSSEGAHGSQPVLSPSDTCNTGTSQVVVQDTASSSRGPAADASRQNQSVDVMTATLRSESESPGQLLHTILSGLLPGWGPHLETWPLDCLPKLVLGLGLLGHKPPPEWMQALDTACMAHSTRFGYVSAIRLLEGLALLGHTPPKPLILDLTLSLQRALDWLTPAQLATLLHSLAVLGRPPPAAWLQQFIERSSSKLPGMRPHLAALLLDAMTRLKYQPPVWWSRKLLQYNRRHLSHATPADVAVIAAAVARLDLQPPRGWVHDAALVMQGRPVSAAGFLERKQPQTGEASGADGLSGSHRSQHKPDRRSAQGPDGIPNGVDGREGMPSSRRVAPGSQAPPTGTASAGVLTTAAPLPAAAAPSTAALPPPTARAAAAGTATSSFPLPSSAGSPEAATAATASPETGAPLSIKESHWCSSTAVPARPPPLLRSSQALTPCMAVRGLYAISKLKDSSKSAAMRVPWARVMLQELLEQVVAEEEAREGEGVGEDKLSFEANSHGDQDQAAECGTSQETAQNINSERRATRQQQQSLATAEGSLASQGPATEDSAGHKQGVLQGTPDSPAAGVASGAEPSGVTAATGQDSAVHQQYTITNGMGGGAACLPGIDALLQYPTDGAQVLVDVVYVCAELRYTLSPSQEGALLRRLMRALPWLAPAQCASLMVCFAVLRVVPPPGWCASFFAHVHASVPRFTSQELANTLTAAGYLDLDPGQPLLDSTLARVRSMDLVEQAMLVRKLDQQGRVVGRVPWLKALRTTVGRIFGSAGATQDQQRGGGGRGSG